MDRYFQVRHQDTYESRFVTPSAFSQARNKINASAFYELNHFFVDAIYQDPTLPTWNRHRLLAIDSSALRLPNESLLTQHFGGQPSSHKQSSPHSVTPMARLSTCIDLLTSITLDAQLAPYSASERDLAAQHLIQTKADDLIIYDRGYCAFWLLALHRDKDRQFCMRVKTKSFTAVTAFEHSSATDAIITISPHKTAIKRCENLQISSEPIQLRAVKVWLSTGEVEILLTSLLDTTAYPTAEFGALYARRWGVETDFDFKKNVIQIENFSGVSVNAIYQDVYAKVLTQNIAMASTYAAQVVFEAKRLPRKLRYKINVSCAISKMKDLLVKFSIAFDALLIEKYIEVLSLTTEACRPGRSFERKKYVRDSYRAFQSIKAAA